MQNIIVWPMSRMIHEKMLEIIQLLSGFLQNVKPNLIKFFYTNCPVFLRICFTFTVSEQCNRIIYRKIEELKNEVYEDIKFNPPSHGALVQIYRLSMLVSILDDIKLKKEIQKILEMLRNEYKNSLSTNHNVIKFLDYTNDVWFENILTIKPIWFSFRLVNLIKNSEGITLRGELYDIFDLKFLNLFVKCLEFRAIVKLFLLIIILFTCFALYLL